MDGMPAALYRAGDGSAGLRSFRRAVSLHGHTSFSRESLDFIPRYAALLPLGTAWLEQELARYRRKTGRLLHFEQGYWTGPVGPVEAWELETSQIEALDLEAIVSITDHDDIQASLQFADALVSTEWTVPFRSAILHLGVHNLPRNDAPAWIAQLNAVTAKPKESEIAATLAALSALPESLVVLNHPLWALDGGAVRHCASMLEFLRIHRQWIDALEWNGIRPDRENRRVFQLASELGLPVVSGGDRHGREPAAVVNLTRAVSFGEFSEEVRFGKRSSILAMKQYERPRRLRLIETMWDILREYPGHARPCLFDRVFYEESGVSRSLSSCWAAPPPMVAAFLAVMKVLESAGQPLLRAAFESQWEGLGD